MNILFVCSSNICRSPYCEFVFRRMAAEDDVLADKLTVRSAAVFNKSRRIHPKARIALAREGFSEAEIDAHKPAFKWGDGELFRAADVIVGMTRSHKWFLPCRYRKKFITLAEWTDGKYTPIPDPFLMKDTADYLAVMDAIKGYLVKLRTLLRAKLEGNAGAPQGGTTAADGGEFISEKGIDRKENL